MKNGLSSRGGRMRKWFREKKIAVVSSLIRRLTENIGVGILQQVQVDEKEVLVKKQQQLSLTSEHFPQHLNS
jgi:hypothetical protein